MVLASLSGRRQAAGWFLGLTLAMPPLAWLGQRWLGLGLQPATAVAWLWAIALSPLLEESVYRRLLQDGAADLLHRFFDTGSKAGAHLANLIAALGFVAVHATSHGWFALWWLLPALLLGEVYRRTRSLLAAVALHGWMNISLAGVSLA